MRALATMYPLPELAAVNAAWWDGLTRHWRAAGLQEVPPFGPFPDEPYDVWLAPDLFIAQTCGYPLTHRLKDRVTVVATPCYAATGCAGVEYCSRLIVRSDSGITQVADLAGKVAAINGYDSQSGWNVLRHALAPLRKDGAFPRIVETGAHRNSIAAVREGRADIAAVDCVTFDLISKAAPADVAGLRVLDDTARAPALPYITRKDISDADLDRLRAGLTAAATDPALADVRRALLIRDIVVLPAGAYDRILEIEAAGCA